MVYDGEKYEKLDVEDLAEEPLAGTFTGTWVASINIIFLGAAIPPADQPWRVTGNGAGESLLAGRG